MNKLLILLLLTSISLSASAQKLYLETVESQMDFTNYNYFYNINDHLERFNESDNYGSSYMADLRFDFDYDNQGLQTQMFGYQKLEGAQGDGFVNTMKYFFTYDDQGRLLTQTNYNYNFTGFKLGGIYQYFYNTDGRIEKRYLFFDEDMANVREVKYYDYDDKGQLIETEVRSSFTTEEEAVPESRTLITYDDKGYMVKREHFAALGSEWRYDMAENFAYDANGNLVERVNYRDTPTNASEKDTYTYNEQLTANTVLPVYIGSDFDENFDNYVMTLSPNTIATHTLYKISYETSQLDVFDVCTYYYASERPSMSAIHDTAAEPSISPVTYYDLSGRRINRPAGGLFIERQGSRVKKIIL